VNRPTSRTERVELGVQLLAHLDVDELSLAAAVDRIETVTTSPTVVRDVLDTAEKRGVIVREDARLRVTRGGTVVDYESQVSSRPGEFTCARCGTGITTGYFVRFDSGEVGPFGSSCVRKVTGRVTE
jgi:hypothetical protein